MTHEHLLIVCGPSGVGKSTLVRNLLARRPHAVVSVSTTTRPLRGAERDGVDYHFVDRAAFEAEVAAGAFAEWAQVHGNLYGTSRAVIDEAVGGGRDVVFDIDYQGARQLKQVYPGAWAVLVGPPDLPELERRLRGRKTDSAEVIERRLENARDELAQHALFDFVIINDSLAEAEARLLSVYDLLGLRHERAVRAASQVFAHL